MFFSHFTAFCKEQSKTFLFVLGPKDILFELSFKNEYEKSVSSAKMMNYIKSLKLQLGESVSFGQRNYDSNCESLFY